MGCQRLIVLTAFLLFAKDHEVYAQYAGILECLSASPMNLGRPSIQSAGQYVLPAIIQPIIPAYDTSYAPDPAPGYAGNNLPAPYPGYPPIIINDDSDFWHKLLYFIIFAMKNKQANNTPPAYNNGCNSCNCCCCNSGKSACCCNCCNCKNSDSSTPTYIPIPIAIPIFTGLDCFDFFPGLSDDVPSLQACNGKESNEISLTIRAE